MELGDIKTIQFELWHNCNNNCEFCYLNGDRIISNAEEQTKAIVKTREVINSAKMDNYNAIGLIGGEFFQGQLSDPQVFKEWKNLIQDIRKKYDENKISESWITASLMESDLSDLYTTLDILPKDKKVLLSTSYDTIGRFKSQEQKELWLLNISTIKKKYPNVVVHTQIILTQSFIDEIITGSNIIERILQYSTLDFKVPGMFRRDYSKIAPLNEHTYHEALVKNKDNLPQGFFIEHRNDFLKFLHRIVDIFGVDKIKWFSGNEVRSKTLYLLPRNIVIEDRWDKNNQDENATCGHVYDSYCYLDSDKCSRCDALRLYTELA